MSNRDVVQSIYTAAGTGDVSAIEKVLADDIVLLEPAHHPMMLGDPQRAPGPGVWRGREAAVEAIGQVFGALGLTGVTLHDILVDGDRAVGLLDVHGTGSGGRPYSMPMAEVFTLRDGKVVEIRAFYFDTAELCELTGVLAR